MVLEAHVAIPFTSQDNGALLMFFLGGGGNTTSTEREKEKGKKGKGDIIIFMLSEVV